MNHRATNRSIVALLAFLLIGAAAHRVCGQVPPVVEREMVALPEIVGNGGAIRHWTVNGKERAIFVRSNVTVRTVVKMQSPKLGGTQTQTVARVTLTTNAVQILTTNGIHAYKILPSAPVIRRAYVITGLQTSTDLTTWTDVGWWMDEPARFFRVATNGLTLNATNYTN